MFLFFNNIFYFWNCGGFNWGKYAVVLSYDKDVLYNNGDPKEFISVDKVTIIFQNPCQKANPYLLIFDKGYFL